MRINDMFTGAILAVLSISLYLYAQSLPHIGGLSYGPGTFPSLIACGLFLGSLGLLFSGFKDFKNRQEQDKPSPDGVKKSTQFLYALSVPVAITAYMVLSPWLGFSIVCFAIVGVMVSWLSKRWKLGLIVAAATTTVMWFAFAKALQVPLPTFSF
ncbi:tripartite tricarboxylate transporter TctB family protein [Paenalcaligenes niemegkensis]|uniref:tripartite tricarboxylate transporter TctB family protein n=1 Tax=Paenalcaligenes niemegkensis TaxID=2895469 RepID=UPI001EE7D168|nr:tripartite tricarboxylate transporter TctB family protein [Paenalcaligenes niemegkensis]MCQ9618289.1 tripartite tricarboxylate transporter TctB family protein [Paenalcaligenes niemegkensis]